MMKTYHIVKINFAFLDRLSCDRKIVVIYYYISTQFIHASSYTSI